jgi:hypothetical protein
MAITLTDITIHTPTITDRIRTMATTMGLHSIGTAEIDIITATIVIITAIADKLMRDADRLARD